MVRSLPPPIHDPTSGKTFVAIPAPPFVFAENATYTTSDTPSRRTKASDFVYVEQRTPIDNRRMFTAARYETPKEKRSVNKWTSEHRSVKAPPGHIPWTGHVSHVSPAASVESLSLTTASNKVVLPESASKYMKDDSLLVTEESDSTFEIPSLGSNDLLLNGSLPSTCSSAWSAGIEPPPLLGMKALKTRTSLAVIQPLAPIRPLTPRKKASHISDVSSRREAHVVDRRLTLEKIEKVPLYEIDPPSPDPPSMMDDMIKQIDELSAIFSESPNSSRPSPSSNTGRKLIFQAPSLVVSTSTNVMPVTFDNSIDAEGTKPLAVRRGKNIPGSLNLKKPLAPEMDYPDIPTPFRGSPGPSSESFSSALAYPELKLDTTLSTEDMIASLREQVESFKPILPPTPDAFTAKCLNVENWLQNNIVEDEIEVPPHVSLTDDKKVIYSNSPSNSPSASPPSDSLHVRGSHPFQSTPEREINSDFVKLPSENLKDWNEASRRSSGSRRARFSAAPPAIIPYDILPKTSEPNHPPCPPPRTPLPALPSTPKSVPIAARSPQPSAIPQARKSPVKQFPATGLGRQRSMSTGSPLNSSPRRNVGPPVRRRAESDAITGTLLSKAQNTSPVKGPRTLSMIARGKENRTLKVAGFTFSKRRSHDAVADDNDGKKAQGKSRIQGVLSRLRG